MKVLSLKNFILTTITLFLCTFFIHSAFAAPVNLDINYQGKLTNSAGAAVTDGTYNMRFYLYNAVGGATTSAIWTETLTTTNRVQVTNGLFSVMLGSTTPLTSVNFNQTLYLGVEIGGLGGTIAWDGEMSPRKILGTVPSAFESQKVGGVASSSFLRSDQADTLEGSSASTLLTITQNSTGRLLDLINSADATIMTALNSGNIGIGTTTPNYELVVNGDFMLSGGLFDTNYSAGTNGQVLQTTGTGVDWVSTSTLGFGTSNVDTLNDLSDVNAAAVLGSLLYYDGSGWNDIATSTLNIALTNTTGTLGVTRGGTGLSSIAVGSILYGSGVNTISSLVAGTNGYVLQLSSGVPAWVSTTTLGISGGSSYFTDNGTITYLTTQSDTLSIGTSTNVSASTALAVYNRDIEVLVGAGTTNGAAMYGVGSIVDGAGGATELNGPWEFTVVGDYAYVAGFDDDGFQIIDISDPTNLVGLGEITDNTSGAVRLTGANGVAVQGNYAYVSSYTENALQIIDISDPTAPVGVGYIDDNTNGATALAGASGVAVQGNYVYVTAETDGGFQVIDVSDPKNPKGIGVITDNTKGATGLSSPVGIAIQGSYAYVMSYGDATLQVIDISDPTNPIGLDEIVDNGTTVLLNSAVDIAISGSYAYIPGPFADSLQVIDISDPDNLVELDNITDGANGADELDEAWSVALAGNYAFVSGGTDDGIQIIDISNPSSLVGVGSISDGVRNATNLNSVRRVRIQGNYLYSSAVVDDAFQVISLPTFTSPTANIGSLASNNISTDFLRTSQLLSVDGALNVGTNAMIGGALTITGTASSGLQSANNSAALVVTSGYVGIGTTSPYENLSLAGDFAITGGIRANNGSMGTNGMVMQTTGSGIQWVATSSLAITSTLADNSITPDKLLSTSQTDEYCISYESSGDTWEWKDCGIQFTDSGTITYLTTQTDTLAIGTSTNVSASTGLAVYNRDIEVLMGDVLEVGSISDGASGATELGGAHNLEIVGDYAYIASYTDNGFQILDISDPENIVGLGEVTDGASGATALFGAYDVAVDGNYAYVTGLDDNAVQAIDISDPTNPVGVGSIVDGTNGADRLAGANQIVVQGNYAYVTTEVDDGLQIIDISDPKNMRGVGSITDGTKGATEMDWTVGVTVQGSYAYVSSFLDDGFQIIDISDPTNPIGRGEISDGASGATELAGAQGSVVVGSYAYVASNGDSGFQIIDVSDPDAPVGLGEITDNTNGAINLANATGISVYGDYAYVAGTSGEGLQIINISNPSNPYGVGTGDDATTLYYSAIYKDYLIMTSLGSSKVVSFKLPTFTSPTANIGSLAAGNISTDFLRTSQLLSVDGALNVGTNALIGGALTITGTASSGLQAANNSAALVVTSGYVGIGTTSPYENLSLQGDFAITGGIRANNGSMGTNGMVMQTTGSGIQWVATTSLGVNYNALAVTATGLSYSGGTLSQTAGYIVPLTASTTNWNTFYNTPSNRITVGNDLSWDGNTLAMTSPSVAGGYSVFNGANVTFGPSSAVETTVVSESIPADTLTADGQEIAFTVIGTVTQNNATARAFTLRFKVGGTTVYADTTGTMAQSATARPVIIVGKIIRMSATTAKIVADVKISAAATATTGSFDMAAAAHAVVSTVSTNATWDWSSATTFATTIQLTSNTNFSYAHDMYAIGVNGDTSASAGGSLFTDGGTITYLTSLTDILAIGTSTNVSATTGLAVYNRDVEVLQGSPQKIGSAAAADATTALSIVGDYAYVCSDATGNDLQIYNIADHASNPTLVGGVNLTSSTNGLFIQGNYAYTGSDAAAGNEFQVVDITDKTTPVVVGGIEVGDSISALYVSGKYAYIATGGTDHFAIYDISDPTAPYKTDGVDLSFFLAVDVFVRGNYAYLLSDEWTSELGIYDISNPYNIIKVGAYDLGDTTNSFKIVGNYAYIASWHATKEFDIVDISDPTNPTEVGSYDLADAAWGVEVIGNYAYVSSGTTGAEVEIFDIRDPAAPQKVGAINSSGQVGDIVASAGYLYVNHSSQFDVFKLPSLVTPTANIGSLASNRISTDYLSVTQLLSVESALNVGTNALIGGALTITGTASSSRVGNVATTTLTITSGYITMGDGDTTGMTGLQIGYGGICVDNDGLCTASTSGRITADQLQSANSDLAETYFSEDDLETGEIVSLKNNLSVNRASKDDGQAILGVVSTNLGLLLGYDDISLDNNESSYPIALKGRVPVKVSTENGDIKRGDHLMLSSISGVAMKAKGSGTIIGIALEDFNDDRMYSDTYVNQFIDNLASSTKVETEEQLLKKKSRTAYTSEGQSVKVGQVVMFVNLQERFLDDETANNLALLMGTELPSTLPDEDTLFTKLARLADGFVDGVLSILSLKAERVEVGEVLCLNNTCVNGDDIRLLIENQALSTPAEPQPELTVGIIENTATDNTENASTTEVEIEVSQPETIVIEEILNEEEQPATNEPAIPLSIEVEGGNEDDT